MRFVINPIAAVVTELRDLEGVIGFGNAHGSVRHIAAHRAHNLLDLNGNNGSSYSSTVSACGNKMYILGNTYSSTMRM
jgi:hypothetical protein